MASGSQRTDYSTWNAPSRHNSADAPAGAVAPFPDFCDRVTRETMPTRQTLVDFRRQAPILKFKAA
jgi:hypothetical protein